MDKNFEFGIKGDLKRNKKPIYFFFSCSEQLYNLTMEIIVNSFVYSFILDYFISVSQKKLFRLEVKNVCLLLLQVLNISSVAVFLFCNIAFYQFLLIKLLANLIISLLITNSYKFKEITHLFVSYVIILFSVYGFAIFLTEFARVVISQIFGVFIERIYDYLILFGIFIFVFVIVFFAQNIGKNKTINSFLMKVSFSLFGKHIEITGLLDSGNVLYDTKSSKAVIVVSASIFKQVLPKKDYQKFIQNDYSSVKVSNQISYVSVGGKKLVMPIFDVGVVKVSSDGKIQTKECVIGVVNQEFDGGKYQCLLHRDFV